MLRHREYKHYAAGDLFIRLKKQKWQLDFFKPPSFKIKMADPPPLKLRYAAAWQPH